jgi:hypothetical protein
MNDSALKPLTVNGQEIHWECRSGLVIGLRKYTKTHVSGEGDRHGVNIRSQTETVTEFFLKGADGSESSHQFSWEDVALRDGHRVSFVYGVGRGPSWVVLVNHDTKQWWEMQFAPDFLYATGAFWKPRFLWLLPCGAAGAVALALSCISVALVLQPVLPANGQEAPSANEGASAFVGQIVGWLVCWPFMLTGVLYLGAWFVQRQRCFSAWGRVARRLEEIAGQVLDSTNSIPWPTEGKRI